MRRTSAPRAVRFIGVGDRQIRVIASDATQDRMGDVLVPSGVQLENYRRNPIVLAQHDASAPIARCSSIGVEGDKVMALIDFPPAGTSARSDEYLALAKAGILGSVSVGFLPFKWDFIPAAGQRFTSWELLELSIVSVPANPSALITERAFASSVAADLARALAIRARVHARSRPPARPAAEPDWTAWQAEQDETRRREQLAGAMRVSASMQW